MARKSAQDPSRVLASLGYKPLGPIACGAFSTILRCKDLSKGLEVAVKSFDGAKCAREPTHAALRDNELEVLRLLRHVTHENTRARALHPLLDGGPRGPRGVVGARGAQQHVAMEAIAINEGREAALIGAPIDAAHIARSRRAFGGVGTGVGRWQQLHSVGGKVWRADGAQASTLS